MSQKSSKKLRRLLGTLSNNKAFLSPEQKVVLKSLKKAYNSLSAPDKGRVGQGFQQMQELARRGATQ